MKTPESISPPDRLLGRSSPMLLFRAPAIALCLLLAAVAAAPFFITARSANQFFLLEMELTSYGAGNVQIYYHTGGSYNEDNSQRQHLPGSGKPTVYRFPLANGVYQGFRLDPTDNDHSVFCTYIRVVDRAGQVIHTFPLEDSRVTHQMALVRSPEGIEMRPAPGANDPYCVLPLAAPLPLSGPLMFWERLRFASPVFLGAFLLIWLMGSVGWHALGQQPAPVPPSRPETGPRTWWLAGGMLAAILFRFWLTSAQPAFVFAPAIHDDNLFVDLARNLTEGKWLGPYNQFTLAKGLFYPILMAVSYKLGIPFFAAMQLGYSLACVLVVVALRPLLPHRGIRFGLFLVLLFNPIYLDVLFTARSQRQNLLPLLTLFILAGLIGLHTRRTSPLRLWLPWALLTGLALPAFWLTREESIWLLPAIVLPWGYTVYAIARRTSGPDRARRLLITALPAALWAGGIAIVAAINLYHYNIFTTCEFKCRDLKNAFGALLRIEAEPRLPYITVPRAAREQLYPLSPAFAELRPFLEGPLGDGWAASSEVLTNIAPEKREIANGWFMWALRDATALAGYYRSGDQAMAFYARLAKEINAACDQLKIKAGPRRSGFMAPLQSEQFAALGDTLIDATAYFCTFKEIATGQPLPFSVGTADELADFARLTHSDVVPRDSDPPPLRPKTYQARLATLAKISSAYQVVMPWVGGASFLAWLAAGCIALAKRQLPYVVWLSLGLLGSVIALILAITLIHVSSFNAIITSYFSGSYGIWLLFCAMAWLALAETLRRPPPTSY